MLKLQLIFDILGFYFSKKKKEVLRMNFDIIVCFVFFYQVVNYLEKSNTYKLLNKTYRLNTFRSL